MRLEWIRERGDVEAYAGRAIQPIDDGYLSDVHVEHAVNNGLARFPALRREPLRARAGAVSQLAYARRGVITQTGTIAQSGRSGGRPAALYHFTDSRLRVTDEFAALRPPGP